MLPENFVVMGCCDLVAIGCVEVVGEGFILFWLKCVACDFSLWIVVGILLLLPDDDVEGKLYVCSLLIDD